MRLDKAPMLKKLAQRTASPLSRIVCSKLLHTPMRALDAYLNFLMGKGSGTGWDLAHEIKTALACVHRKCPVVFDVGANVGEWSEAFLANVPAARLYLFEPSPGAQNAIRARNLGEVMLVPCAVGDRPGKARLLFSSPLDRTASLHQRRESYFRHNKYQSLEVDVVTLDQIIQERQIDFVDFVKMDIEGHELRALEGASAALQARRIGAFSFEFGAGNINSRTFFRDLWDFLVEHGFRLSRITPSGRLLPIDNYYEDCEYFRGVSNYIAELKHCPPAPPTSRPGSQSRPGGKAATSGVAPQAEG
jgi:FkbM family methyltransferase